MTLTTLRHALVVLMLMLTPEIGHAAEWNIDQLMQRLAQIRTDRASFIEKKYIAILDSPVVSSGELFYAAPDFLEKRTIKPKPESMILDKGTLVVTRGRQKHHLQLQEYPELAAFIDSIRSTLAGDRNALERNFRLNLNGTMAQWTLQLLPLDEKMQAVVKQIRITGVRETLRSVEVNQTDGDRSLMLVEHLTKP
jgi:hypothetical protein